MDSRIDGAISSTVIPSRNTSAASEPSARALTATRWIAAVGADPR